MFQAHAFLLSLYFIMVLTGITIDYSVDTAGGQSTLTGVANITVVLSVFAQCGCYILVLYLMLPITDEQMKHRADFNTFLLDGFIDVRQLEEAILAQNPDLTAAEKSVIVQDLNTFNKLLAEAASSSSIISEMTIVNKD
jgi:hypothetical protein